MVLKYWCKLSSYLLIELNWLSQYCCWKLYWNLFKNWNVNSNSFILASVRNNRDFHGKCYGQACLQTSGLLCNLPQTGQSIVKGKLTICLYVCYIYNVMLVISNQKKGIVKHLWYWNQEICVTVCFHHFFPNIC